MSSTRLNHRKFVKSQGPGGVFQPLSLIFRHKWRQFFVNRLMIRIESPDIFRRQPLDIHAVQIDGHIGQYLKMHELAIFIFFSLTAKQFVLDPDTMAAFHINPWLIRCHHACLQDRRLLFRVLFPPKSIGPFMYAQKITHAMACTATMIHADIPQRSPGQYIQCLPGTTVNETG